MQGHPAAGPLLAIAPVSRPADATDRLWIVDGTLVPVRDRTVGASSRNYRFSANVQVIIDANTRLVVATARPERKTPSVGRTTVIADGGCRGTGLVIPHRRERGRAELLAWKEEHNASHRKVRARVEHAFARVKTWKILRDCRLKGDGVHHAMLGIARLHNLALAG